MNSWVRLALAVLLLASAAVLPAASSGARLHRHRHHLVDQDWGNPQTGPQFPYQISDSFNGTSLNPAVFGTDQQSDGTTQGVQDGSLRLTASSAASSGFHDGILTRCQAVGDFDAQIRFTLSTWPAGDNVTLAVNAPPLGNTFVASAVGGDVYGLFVSPSGFITIPASVRSGELRLSRRGDLTSAYVRSGHGWWWHQIAQFSGSTGPTWVGVAIWNISDFGGQPVSVKVDSFKLDAAALSC
jgi:hypothetical protein